MPRPLWSGAVTFGLVTVPVKLEAASESHSVAFRQVHMKDGEVHGRVRNQKRCELDGQVLTEDDIGKGYEVTKDEVIPITDEDLAGMPLPTARAIEIVAFIPAGQVDPVQFGAGSYYLSASGEVSAKPYVLLRQALDRTEKVAVAKFALRGRERLGLLRPLGDALLLSGLHWGDEIRSSAELAPPDTELTDDEIQGALTLMDTMTVESIDDVDVADHYTDALLEVLEAKAEHRAPAGPAGEEAPTAPVVDLMAALEASVAKAKEARGETSGPPAIVHEMPKPKKKTAAKKAPAKKTAAKKTASRRRKSA
ncbi:Ku protein [Streptomyces sp. NPDC056362]|uniref:non-homologous end joining protein Ku n=1 Tax=unclassified Streptomyces TaxID=2593676 RepID=UPI0035DF5F9D